MPSKETKPSKRTQFDRLLHDCGTVRIDIKPKYVTMITDKGICRADRVNGISETLELLAKHINERYEEEYGSTRK